MTKFTKITLLTLTSLLLFAGCGTKEEIKTPSKTDTAESQQKSETNNPETVSFFADGEYQSGVDIEPGSYYAVLTEMDAKGDNAYISFSHGTDFEDWDNYENESLKTVDKPYKIEVDNNTRLKFESIYDVTTWNVTFFTADDYKEYQKAAKK